MKMDWKTVKKPGFIIGAIVLFFVVLWFVNRSGGGSTGTIQTSNGVDPNQLAAATQIQLAQIGAGVQVAAINADYAKSQDQGQVALALAQIQAASDAQNIAAQRDIAEQTIALNAHQMDLQYQESVNSNATALAYEQNSYNYALQTNAQNIAFQENLSQQQLTAYEFAGIKDVIQQFGNPARRQAYVPALVQFAEGQPVNVATTTNVGGGGFNPIGLISPVANVVTSL